MSRSTDEQVAALRRELQAMQLRLDSVRARDMVPGRSAQVRLARISNTPELGDNTFEIVFLDGSYVQSPGMQSALWTPRQTAARTVALNITGQKLNQGTVVLAVYWSQRWWIDRVVSTGDPPDFPDGDQRWYNPTFHNFDASGTPTNEYLWRDGPTIKGVTFGLTVGSVGITHDNADLDFTDSGNFTVNQTGSYRVTTSAWWRLARDSSGAAAPPSTIEPFGFKVQGTGGVSPQFLEEVTWSHNQSTGWGISDTIYFTWQPNYLRTYISWRNFTAGDRFNVAASIANVVPGGYGVSIENLVISMAYLGAPHATI